MDCAFAAAARQFRQHGQLHIAARTNTACPVAERDYTMQNEPVEPDERTRRKPPADLVHA